MFIENFFFFPTPTPPRFPRLDGLTPLSILTEGRSSPLVPVLARFPDPLSYQWLQRRAAHATMTSQPLLFGLKTFFSEAIKSLFYWPLVFFLLFSPLSVTDQAFLPFLLWADVARFAWPMEQLACAMHLFGGSLCHSQRRKR